MALTGFEIVERTPLRSNGKTGASIERVRTADGRQLICKHIQPAQDWLMQATGDDGRLFRLWERGVFDCLPVGVDSAIEAVEETADGWVVLMRDVTDALVWPGAHPGARLPRDTSRRITRAAASLHEAYKGTAIDGLCPLVDKLAFLTPSVTRSIEVNPLQALVFTGWERFAELAPSEVSEAFLGLLERPGRVAAALNGYPQTLLHGDLKVANIAIEGETAVLLDWGTLTGMGPAACDHAWYLAVNGSAIDASLDDLLADTASVLAPDDRPALPLALLGALLQNGWEKGLGATHDDPVRRAREAEGLSWWCARAAEALEA